MKKIRRSCANMDTITTNNQWYENNFVCILEERYNPEEVEKLLDGESIVDETEMKNLFMRKKMEIFL